MTPRPKDKKAPAMRWGLKVFTLDKRIESGMQLRLF